jgi:hypothetical protein
MIRQIDLEDAVLREAVERQAPGCRDWYLASPYTVYPSPDLAWRDACRLAAAFTQSTGHFVYSPIAETAGLVLHGSLKLTHAQWMERDKICVDRAAGLLVAMLPGWHTSKGIAMEIAWARAAGKPIIYLIPVGYGIARHGADHVPAGAAQAMVWHPDLMREVSAIELPADPYANEICAEAA